MAAIIDYPLIHASGNLLSSLVVLPGPENKVIAVGISLLSCLQAELYVISYDFRLMGAIFEFRHTQTSDSHPTSLSVLPDSENTGKAVAISLLSCIKTQIYMM